MMNKRNIGIRFEKFFYVIVALAMGAPFFSVHADDADTFSKLVKDTIFPLIDAFIGLIMVLAVLAFIIGVIRFMYTAGNDKSRESGKNLLVWGTIAMLVLVSVWGLVKIIKLTFFG